jgi:two-component system, NtrC family, nitrogen regulation sensor histidine kinase NtrY
MAFKQFGFMSLFIRLSVLCFSIAGFVCSFQNPRYHAVTLLMLLVVLVLAYELWYFLRKTNREVARFLSAARYADFNQSFEFNEMGGGFKELGEALTDILNGLKQARTKQEKELQFLHATIDHIPAPLISIGSDGRLSLLNNAARSFFGTAQPANLAELKQLGENLYSNIADCKVGEKRLVKVSMDGTDTQLTMVSTEITSDTGTCRLISLQDIGRELESTQLNAWRDLVRVLTHEIMNSITPVASLAQTTADIAGDVDQELENNHPCKPGLHKVRDAATTLARRADNLMQFVSNYRQLTRLPKPNKQNIKIQEILDHVVEISRADHTNEFIKLESNVSPAGLELCLDREQIEQTLINIIRNAQQALAGRNNGVIHLQARLDQRGRTIIEASDNGPGIEEKILSKIFVPYFTTKSEGSGIGLALARQVIISHGGNIKASNLESGGARFTITL